MRAALAGALLAFVGCSGPDDSGALRIAVEDPHQRLGRPPWAIAAFNPYLGPDEKTAFWAKGQAAPGKPYAVRTDQHDHYRLIDTMPHQEQHLGLALPALRPDGYFLARLKWVYDPRTDLSSPKTEATAVFCRWGEFVPEPGAETLALHVGYIRHKPPVVEYVIDVKIPPPPTKGSM